MRVAVATKVAPRDENANGRSTRTGSYDGRRLQEDDAPDGLNFILVRNVFADNPDQAFKTPRHRHTFAQVKMVERGSSNFAPDRYIEEGDIAYFPRAVYYGPQAKDNCTSIAIQFGFNGEHQKGKVWEGYRQEAVRRLKERGEIVDGTFVETDPATGETRTKDGVEAVYEEQYRMHTNREFTVAPASYEDVILLHPKAFHYHAVAPGVELKRLGRFYDQPGPDGDVAISMVRLSDGGTFHLAADRAQVAWTLQKGLMVDGETFPELTSVYSPLGDEGRLSAEGSVELYFVEFPRPS